MMPIVQPYRDCKCINDCYDAFTESVHYSYFQLMPGRAFSGKISLTRNGAQEAEQTIDITNKHST